MRMTRAAAVAALAGTTCLPAAVAVAQPGGVGAACDIDVLSPKELATISSITLPGARSATDAAKRQGALRTVMKELHTKPERFAKNQAGYQYVLTQVLTLWAIEPEISHQTTRVVLGYPTNPDEPVDIIVELDKAFRAIVAAQPACENEVAGLRQNEAWLALTKRALEASGNGQLDTAMYYSNRALLVSTSNPYPYYILGNVANQKGDKQAAVDNWKKTIDMAADDTSYADVVAGSRYYAGLTLLDLAQSASGDEQRTKAKEAAALLRDHIAADPKGNDLPNIMNALVDGLQMAGDTADIPGVYKPLLDDVDGYADIALTMGGIIAARANRTDDALALFEGSLKKNPYGRDALTNVAAAYYGKEQFEKMFEPLRTLITVDPNNPESWLLFAYASQGLAKATTVPATRRAWTDSLVKYQTKADELPVKVDVGSFTRNTDSAILQLSIATAGTSDGGSYEVTVEFLDLQGGVVSTETKPVTLEKGDRKSLRFDGKGEGIVAYRYKPIG